jgi:hypothetical protein
MAATLNKSITLNEKSVLEIHFRITVGASKRCQSFQFDLEYMKCSDNAYKLMMIFELLKKMGFPSVPETKL